MRAVNNTLKYRQYENQYKFYCYKFFRSMRNNNTDTLSFHVNVREWLHNNVNQS